MSIIDYPDFLDCEGPDFEIYSKALNAGQFPVSVVAMRQEVADQYVIGTYGNTMTANPRALDVSSAVIEQIDESLTRNVRERGVEFVDKLSVLQSGSLAKYAVKVQGTGLLASMELVDEIPVVGNHGVEQEMRRWGVNIIHGGHNAIRYTPWLKITSEEIDLLCEATEKAVLKVANQ